MALQGNISFDFLDDISDKYKADSKSKTMHAPSNRTTERPPAEKKHKRPDKVMLKTQIENTLNHIKVSLCDFKMYLD